MLGLPSLRPPRLSSRLASSFPRRLLPTRLHHLHFFSPIASLSYDHASSHDSSHDSSPDTPDLIPARTLKKKVAIWLGYVGTRYKGA